MTDRTKLMQLLAKRFPSCWFKEGELFSEEQAGAIWSGSDSKIDDLPMLNVYASSNKKYYGGIHLKLYNFLKRHGWYNLYYDAGTTFFYPKD